LRLVGLRVSKETVVFFGGALPTGLGGWITYVVLGVVFAIPLIVGFPFAFARVILAEDRCGYLVLGPGCGFGS
jgi:hypothetical protein